MVMIQTIYFFFGMFLKYCYYYFLLRNIEMQMMKYSARSLTRILTIRNRKRNSRPTPGMCPQNSICTPLFYTQLGLQSKKVLHALDKLRRNVEGQMFLFRTGYCCRSKRNIQKQACLNRCFSPATTSTAAETQRARLVCGHPGSYKASQSRLGDAPVLLQLSNSFFQQVSVPDTRHSCYSRSSTSITCRYCSSFRSFF